MRYIKDMTRHTDEERREFARGAIAARARGDTLVAYCLDKAAQGLFPEKRLTLRQKTLRWIGNQLRNKHNA